MKVKEVLRKNKISASEAEDMCCIVSDLLRAYAEDTTKTEPTAFNTIRQSEKAAEVVREVGYMIVMEYDEEEDGYDEYDLEDDSDRNCSDCPPEECDGRCMSCYYRSV